MSIQPRTAVSLVRAATRAFSSSATSLAEPADASASGSGSKRPPTRRQPLGRFDIRYLDEFQFDDATSLGYLRLDKIREVQSLIQRVEFDRATLQDQRKPYSPPRGSICLTRTIDLSEPLSPVHAKRVLVAPVSKLPLSNADSIHRFKLLAGPRWTPNVPGRFESEEKSEGESEGWIKLSEERFPDGRMNRVAVVETLERLVAAANDASSPLPPTAELDKRHLLARQRKSSQLASYWKRSEAMRARSEIVGGVRGFPKEWLQAKSQ